jgi:hypothetical protein
MSNNVRIRTLLLLVLLAGVSTGCVMNGPPRVGVVYISRQPPVERVEVIPAALAVGFVWIRGWWAWRGAEFAWMQGRWERPIEGRREWVPHRWVHDRNGWYLVEGHWR